jgi:hypothetical protein
MIIHHPDGLYEGIARGRAHEAETVFFEPFTHLHADCGNFVVVGLRESLITDIALQVCVKTALLLLYNKADFGVFDDGIHFESITDDALIL